MQTSVATLVTRLHDGPNMFRRCPTPEPHCAV